MKAITCSQCGALIKRISLRDKFAQCDYCGAKILIAENKERIIEIRDNVTLPPPKRTFAKLDKRERDRLFKTMVEQNNEEQTYSETNTKFKTLFAFVFFGAFVFVPILIGSLVYEKSSPKTAETPEKSPSVITPLPTIALKIQEPLPKINYRSYVQYTTNIDADLIELPIIKLEQLPTTDLKELKKTVFATRKIRVRITIDENGDVSEAKALNGHQVLRDSSIEAAKKSLFSSRKRKTTTVLTYIYILE